MGKEGKKRNLPSIKNCKEVCLIMSWKTPGPRPARKVNRRKPWKSKTKPKSSSWKESGSY